MNRPLTATDLKLLSKNQLFCIANPFVRIPNSERSSKGSVIRLLLENVNPELENALMRAVTLRTECITAKGQAALQIRKQKRKFEQNRRRDEARRQAQASQEVSSIEAEHYLDLPSGDETRQCYRDFYNATSSEALKMSVCAVCARAELDQRRKIQKVPFDDIPNPLRLVPQSPHPAQSLTRGLLLELSGVKMEDGIQVVHMCQECYVELQKPKDLPPKLSLANNLWIGEQPSQLRKLTFAEQLLVSLVYPRVFVFKLMPKLEFSLEEESLQRGMRGTVSSYELDTEGVADMVQGNLLPRRPAILARTVAVTFIGRGQVPKKFLRPTFVVNRGVVYDALVWLKANNPKYYGNITISQENLQELPEDDVPDEITDTVRQYENEEVLGMENDNYIDRGKALEGGSMSKNSIDNRLPDTNEQPDVIPFDISGTVDVDLTKLSAKELDQWAMRNLWKQGKEGAYEVRHGTKPVSDYAPQQGNTSQPNDMDNGTLENYWEKSYPFLFPYGRGGFENLKINHLDLRQHIRWALEYHDKRFRKHETFPFVAFSIIQRRDALASAKVRMDQQSYEKNANLINSVTLDKFKQAERAEANHEYYSDPGIQFLKRQVKVAAGHVMGSDYSRIKLRSQIWSTAMYMGPPTIWLTVNPSDIHDPIAQIFTGADINMDNFISCTGPDSKQRGRNIAADPYAAAKFFHFIIECILEKLMGVKVVQHRVKSDVGIFGKVSAYFGTVESQGRGTLHLHMLLWLKNTPSSEQLQDMLRTETFREKVCHYIKANFRAYLPGLENKDSINSIPQDSAITYSRPINPDAEDYDVRLEEFELCLARMEQIHTCRMKRCLNVDRNGQLKCKRRAPFPCAPEDFVNEKGQWGPKRLYGYVNGWVPGILVNARCNNDGKLLTNGEETKNITFYVTTYAAKKQGKNFNMSAVMAKGYAYHVEHSRFHYSEELKDVQRLLLFRLLNAINREQELSAPMVISYLMGWGDTKTSHTYTIIYWTGFVKALTQQFQELIKTEKQANSSSQTSHADTIETDHETQNNTANDIILQTNSQGKIFFSSQVTDYQFRGVELENCCVLDFFVDTYEEETNKTWKKDGNEINHMDDSKQRGRPRNERSHYINGHPRKQDKCRVRRSAGHRNLPNLVGCQIPRKDDKDSNELYSASILMLLVPWRQIDKLKAPDKTWAETLQNVLEISPRKSRLQFIMSGIQYYHECISAANDAQDGDNVVYDEEDTDKKYVTEGNNKLGITPGLMQEDEEGLTELGLSNLLAAEKFEPEGLHGIHAVECAKYVKIFTYQAEMWTVTNPAAVSAAVGDDIRQLQEWKQQMEEDVVKQNTEADMDLRGEVEPYILNEHIKPSVVPSSITSLQKFPGRSTVSQSPEEVLAPVHPTLLNEDQRRAYQIIVDHLDNTLAGRNPPPLRMILYGEGGTGKSKVIQTVTQTFIERGAKHMLVKAAYTGVAASLIDGKTTHTLASLNSRRKDGAISQQAKKTLQKLWDTKQYLILDEYSMLGKSFLAKLSKNISVGKVGSITGKPDVSFGGVHVILCGDLHQFPPVAQSPKECLFKPIDLVNDSSERKIGRGIYEEFDTVVILKKQMRVTDPVWQDFLNRLRYGRVRDEDIVMLKGLVLGDEAIPTDFTEPPWSDAVLITPRNAVRQEWNECAIDKHCTKTGNRLFICEAEDRIGTRVLTLAERYAVAQRKRTEKRDKMKQQPRIVKLAVGMKVLVTNNLETDLDITNGARGTVVNILLSPDEQLPNGDPIVTLKQLPICVLIQLEHTRASKLNGLNEGVIPIEPMVSKFDIKLQNKDGEVFERTVQRRQLPITAAYSFTDYRAQGQTIQRVIVDIAWPPFGGLSLFNLYVALSRSSGRDTVRLLRPFHDKMFFQAHDMDLLKEDDRLESRNEETKKTMIGKNRVSGLTK